MNYLYWMEEILDIVCRIFRDVLKDPGLKLDKSSSSADTPGWDSLRQVMLVAAIEKHFSIKFSLDDMLESRTVGSICNVVEKLKTSS